MNQGKYVFAQVIGFLPARVFDRCVARYQGNKGVMHFTCWNQMLCMMFGQLSRRESLRDLLVCINAHAAKYYHLGFGRNVTRSNLAHANQKRDWRIYADFAQALIDEAHQQCATRSEFALDISGNVYAFDSTTIDLCLNVFCWATFRKTKAAIKLHTLFDVRTAIPTFVLMTPASVHDVNALDHLSHERGAYYVVDRAYLDCRRLHAIHADGSFFVTRAKHNTRFDTITAGKAHRAAGVLTDDRVRFASYYPAQYYPAELRRICFYDDIDKRSFVFLTNNFDLDAAQIALLYKYRWSVELFFKWIKQHLRIESFWGASENAVKTQIYIALATYALVSIIKSKLALKQSTYEILQVIGVSLMDKARLKDLLDRNSAESETAETQLALRFG